MHAMRGVPMGVTAAQLGHSDMRVTEKHYAHLARRDDPRALPHAWNYERWGCESASVQKFNDVDQEVGGSSPPSCTKQINGLPQGIDRTQ
jgi:hypothetical protein